MKLKRVSLKGLTKRWCIKSTGFILLFLVIMEVCATLIIREVFYIEAKKNIMSAIDGFSFESENYSDSLQKKFNMEITYYVENFPENEALEFTAFDNKDELIATFSGASSLSNDSMPDYYIARFLPEHIHNAVFKVPSGEQVMATSKAFFSKDNEYLGAIRYMLSLENVNQTIYLSIALSLIIGLFIMVFVVFSGAYFIKSIVLPVKEVSTTARRIALGDFNARMNKKYDDEIGELCDTVNYMAGKLSESEKLKNDFISSVSHELRTPLTAIKGWAETIQLSDEKDDEMNQKGLEIIVHEAERLCGIVEELLDFSRMQSGRMILSFDKIDILAEIGEAVYMFKDRARNEEKTLNFTEPEMLPPVMGDKNRLRQVFVNVIDNALKYTPKGGVVSVNAREDKGNILITVQDTGCGIPKEHLPHVMEKFYKANTTQKGSGIGLAVANEIISLHSGTLSISSEEQKGTTATISIPAIEVQDDIR